MENWKIIPIILIGVAVFAVSTVAVYSYVGALRPFGLITAPAIWDAMDGMVDLPIMRLLPL